MNSLQICTSKKVSSGEKRNLETQETVLPVKVTLAPLTLKVYFPRTVTSHFIRL